MTGAAVGGGIEGGAYETGPPATDGGADVGGASGASSEILCVGATLDCAGVRRAPQPPQNRESASFSVPQLGQRIPPSG
jgi:hypothetical protein